METNLPSQMIESRLKLVRGRIRREQTRRALWLLATVLLGGMLLIMAADYFLAPLPNPARWVLFGAWLTALAFTAKAVLGPRLRKISLVQIARWIEIRHPEMEERLSTVLELSKNGTGVSPELLEALGKAAGEDATRVDAAVEIQSARTKLRWGRQAAVLGGVLLLSLAVWPREASRLLVRAVAPFSNVGNAGAAKFKIEPGDLQVMEGDRIEIKVSYTGRAANPEILLKMGDGKELPQPLAHEGKDRYRYVLDPARESFDYRIRAGRAQSAIFSATVWPLPRISDPRAILAYRPYTGLLKTDEPLGERVEAVAGTTVTISGKLNTIVGSGWLEIEGKKIADARIEASASGGRVDFSWKLSTDTSGEAVVKFRHRLGRDIEALRFQVVVLPDQEPKVVLVSPSQKDLKVRPDELLSLQYQVTEDFALAKVSVEASAGGDRQAMFPQTLPFGAKGARPLVFEGTAPVSVGVLRSRFPGVNEMKLRIRAEDGRPGDLGGPGIGNSEWLTIRIDRNAESLARQELRAEHDGARETIEKAIQEARQAKDQMESLREEVKKDSLPENAVKRLEESTKKLSSAQEKVAELAEEMELGVHAAKADEVAKAAENLKEAREALENSPLQDQQQAREQKLNDSRQNAEEAIKQLEEVRNAMDKDREKVQDLVRLQELAQQQQELARQAGENLDGPPPTPQEIQEWKNQQQQVEEQLRQQLRERPDAKAEAFKKQAEEAKAMAQEARETAKAQKQLQQQAQEAPKPEAAAAVKEQLQKALAKEQAKIAAEAKEELKQAQEDRNAMADTLPEATAAADAALEQLQKGEPEAAAQSAEKAAQAMKENATKAEPQAGETGEPKAEAKNAPASPADAPSDVAAESPAGQAAMAEAAQKEALGQLAERQQQVAEAAGALAKGDAAAALKHLQQAQAEAAANLAEEIKETPLAEGSGNMNEAAGKAQQGAQQAGNAGKQGEANQQQQAAGQHEQAAQSFQQSAEALDRAAQEFANLAQQAAAQQANPNNAEVPAAELAEAFQQAGEAAEAEGAEAAQQAAAAAQALGQAAQSARGQMQGKSGPQGQKMASKPQPPGQSGQPGQQAADEMKGIQQKSAPPGVPPELAKLGITAADWEKIRTTLTSDVGAGGADAVPEEYRSLVKGYFESMSKKKE
jgi:hypothetical protein